MKLRFSQADQQRRNKSKVVEKTFDEIKGVPEGCERKRRENRKKYGNGNQKVRKWGSNMMLRK